ncbi:DUF2269 family protein [Paraconexibacter sp.]|uniref:DUF2269 family protein n=1 Tax=Paraconexibacter sp. TaxID=2949640 RepID=UPI003568D47D
MVSTYTVLLALHLLCAVLWVGGSGTLHVLGRIAQNSGDRQRMLQFSKDAEYIGPRLYAPLSLGLLIFGILLVNEVGYDHSDLWITLAYVGWLSSFVIGIAFYPRAARRRDAILEQDGLESDKFLENYVQTATISMVELTILLLVVVDMAIKPG